MSELTINTADIAAAVQKNLEGFVPSLEESQVGRVLEVGDGIARVSGLPDAAVYELLQFESGTYGLALNLEGSIFRMVRQGQRVIFDLDAQGLATQLRLGSEVDLGTPDWITAVGGDA